MQIQHRDDLQTTIGDYTLVQYIGGGQFGKVYKAIKRDSPTIYAIKVVRKLIPNIDESRRRKLRLLLESEIKAMQLCNSDNVVRIVERLESPGKIYIVMEYCDGPNLETYLEQHGVLKEKEALMILRQLACGFQELQRNNIIHRDLKPANIFSSGGNFKIGDLGFARVLQKNEDLTGTLLGSLCYMAPEILTYQKYGFLVDIWSLGVILHMMVTGRRPFGNPMIANFAQMYDEIKYTQLTFKGGKISDDLKDLLRSMLKVNPTDRIQWEDFYNHPLLAEEVDLLISVEFPLLRRDASKDTKKDGKLKQMNHRDFLQDIIQQNDEQKPQPIQPHQPEILPSNIKPPQPDIQKIDEQYKLIQQMGREFSAYTAELLFEVNKLNLLLKYLVVIEYRPWTEFVEESRKLTELRLLVAERCMKKAWMIKSFFQGKESIFKFRMIEEYKKSLQYINIQAEYRFIYEKCKRYYEKTSLNLKVFEDKKRNILKDFVKRHSDSQNYQRKQKFIQGIEGKDKDYSLQEHTQFVRQYAKQIKARWEDMKPCRALYIFLILLNNYESLAFYGGNRDAVNKITKDVMHAETTFKTEQEWNVQIIKATKTI